MNIGHQIVVVPDGTAAVFAEPLTGWLWRKASVAYLDCVRFVETLSNFLTPRVRRDWRITKPDEQTIESDGANHHDCQYANNRFWFKVITLHTYSQMPIVVEGK